MKEQSQDGKAQTCASSEHQNLQNDTSESAGSVMFEVMCTGSVDDYSGRCFVEHKRLLCQGHGLRVGRVCWRFGEPCLPVLSCCRWCVVLNGLGV